LSLGLVLALLRLILASNPLGLFALALRRGGGVTLTLLARFVLENGLLEDG
jgi:hypothetical protein